MEPLNQSARRTASRLAVATTTFVAILLLGSSYLFHKMSIAEQGYYQQRLQKADLQQQKDSLCQQTLVQHSQACALQLSNMDSIYQRMQEDTLERAAWASRLQDAGEILSSKMAAYNETVHKMANPSQKQMYLYWSSLMTETKATYLSLVSLKAKAESAARLAAQLSDSDREKESMESTLQAARSEALNKGNEKGATEGLLRAQVFKNEQLAQKNEQLTKEVTNLQRDLLKQTRNAEESRTALQGLVKQARQDLRDAQDPKRKNRPGTVHLMEGWLNRMEHFLLFP